uniref:Uncharacterized protein n=1 Tax=Rhodnius prolixus TaxID=13249 RepID=A0A0G2KBG2_RHOPR
VIFLILGCL